MTIFKILLSTLILSVLAACDGGSNITTVQGSINGTATKGPVKNGTISAYAINNGQMGLQIATTTTDANGNFTMTTGSYAGPVMLQMSGGTYTDEATGTTTMTMAAGDVMTAVMPTVAAGAAANGVQVTPVTSMAQAMTQHMTSGMTDANIATANAAMGNYFLVSDILRTSPMNPLVTGSGIGASQDAQNYGMALAAISQSALTQGMTSSSAMVTALMNDASDGVMDGMMSGSKVMMGGMTASTALPATAGTSGLGAAMNTFMNSPQNKSGITTVTLMDRLNTATMMGEDPVKTTADACIGATSKWALWSGGTCLRGANVFQTLNNIPFYGGTLGTGPLGPPYSQTDFNALAAMGVNVVNISHPGLFLEAAPYGVNSAAQTNLDNLLTMIQNANMFAVITARTGPGRNEQDIVPQAGLTPLNSVWSTQAEQDAWVAMWRYTAARYQNNPIVVGYDLMNEPHPNAQSVTPVPTYIPSQFYPLYANALFDWNPLAKRISDAIRQVDTTTPILIGGMDWSGATWLNSLTSNGDSKTVYMVHQYEPQMSYTHQPTPYMNTYGTTTSSCGITPCTYTQADLLTQFAYISSFKTTRNFPVGVNEFGVMRFQPGAAQYLTDEMDIMESSGLNYSIWVWDTTYPAFAAVGLGYDQFNFRRGTNPATHTDTVPNVLTTAIQTYFQKNTVRPFNRSF